MEPELRLDPAIRLWVFLPIVLITFLVGIVRHYVSVLLSSQKKVDLSQVKDSQILLRARNLRENARYIPRQVYTTNIISVYFLHTFLIKEYLSTVVISQTISGQKST